MSTFEIWLLAVSLAIDCFTVSVASGIILRRIEWRTFFTMAFFFGFFQALMPLIGWSGANHFSHLIEAYDHWIAFGLLAFLGIRMIREYFKDIEIEHRVIDIEYLYKIYASQNASGDFEVELKIPALKVDSFKDYESYLAVMDANTLVGIYDKYGQ